MDSITILSLEIEDLKKQLAEYERAFETLEDEIDKINELLDESLKVTHPLSFNDDR
jgi:prefoldin subunit 5